MERLDLNIRKLLKMDSGIHPLQVRTSIPKGAFVTLYGRSGSGKTTLLRILAGLTAPDEGTIEAFGTRWTDRKEGFSLPSQKRSVGYVFQDQALFPNMTVLDNIRFAQGKARDEAKIREVVEDTELSGLLDRYPDSLSGGQKQRVAIARVLAMNPVLMLLDEPLSAVDRQMRTQLQDLLKRVHEKYKVTMILVSHDVPEIVRLTDRVIVLDEGAIVQDGTPSEVFTRNAMSCKFRFTGEVIDIVPSEVVRIVKVMVGYEVVKVIADQDTAKGLKIGDVVTLASKAFNPIIEKVRTGMDEDPFDDHLTVGSSTNDQ